MKAWLIGTVVLFCLALPAPAEETPAWARDAVEKLQQQGFLQGYPGGQLNGHRAMTRYEVSQLLNRVQADDQEQHASYATRDSLRELQKSAESVRDSLDSLGSSDLEKRVDALELRLDKLGRPEL